ncbi:extracellular solute-binding protein [Paenibacillus oceani]|uniref:extracellular solute-binding protein n=1 Tax=Paenibacillus oceani TaxID=2772510 RepID=UPI00295BA791|nr:extracellular solute-binding protein [Paenibacillus oceani]
MTELYNRAKEKFEASHSDVSIQFITTNAISNTSITNELKAVIDAGKSPDLVLFGSAVLPSIVGKNGFIDIEQLAKINGTDLNEFFDTNLLGNFKYEDKLFAIPVGATPIVVMYNKKIFSSLGISEPKSDWSWDNFAEIAKRLKNDTSSSKNGVTTIFPLTNHHLSSLVLSNGGSFLSPDGLTMQGYLDSDSSVSAIEWYSKMVHEGIVQPKYITNTPIEVEKGTVGMYVSKYNELSLLTDQQKENMGVVVQPSFSQRTKSIHGSITGMGILKDSKNADLAFEFMKFVTMDSNEITTDLFKSSYNISKSVYSAMKKDQFISVLMESLPLIKNDIYGRNPYLMNIQTDIQKKLEQTILQNQDIKSSLTEVAKSAEPELKKNK